MRDFLFKPRHIPGLSRRKPRTRLSTVRKLILMAITVFVLLLWLGALRLSFGPEFYVNGPWVIGSPPLRFGLQEYGYWTDAGGYIILPRSPVQGVQPGDTFHRRTQIHLGPVWFSVPLQPASVAIIGGGCVVGFGIFVARRILRAFKLRRHENQMGYQGAAPNGGPPRSLAIWASRRGRHR